MIIGLFRKQTVNIDPSGFVPIAVSSPWPATSVPISSIDSSKSPSKRPTCSQVVFHKKNEQLRRADRYQDVNDDESVFSL